MKSHFLSTVVLSSALAFAALPAVAEPSGGGSGGGSSGNDGNEPTKKPTAAELNCKAGQVVKQKRRGGKNVYFCADAQEGALTDEDLFQQASALAKSGHYNWALDLFAKISDQSNPDVLNMIGYSHRKAGRMDVAVNYYRKALDINPDLVQAREYLGEGYVAAGRIDLAEVQLAEIKSRCGMSCSQYEELKLVIEAAIN